MYFTKDDWAKTSEVYEAWWAGTLRRPLIHFAQRELTYPQISLSNCDNFTKPPQEVILEIDCNIQNTEYYGDGFPCVGFEFFGAGVLAAYLGSHASLATDTVWFEPLAGEPALSDIHLSFDPNTPWFCRCKDLYHAAVKHWQGKVMLGMTDIGGEMDVLASLLGTERLLYSLYDEPEEVKRLLSEIHEVWLKVYFELQSIIEPTNPGYMDWPRLFSAKPYYTQQCDFCYMISPAMFDEFVKDTLLSTSKKIERTMYHLDGRGQLPHLDTILQMDKVQAVQWVPGDVGPSGLVWLDVYKKIKAAGKGMEFRGHTYHFADVTSAIGGEGFYLNADFCPDKPKTKEAIRAFLAPYDTDGRYPWKL